MEQILELSNDLKTGQRTEKSQRNSDLIGHLRLTLAAFRIKPSTQGVFYSTAVFILERK